MRIMTILAELSTSDGALRVYSGIMHKVRILEYGAALSLVETICGS